MFADVLMKGDSLGKLVVIIFILFLAACDSNDLDDSIFLEPGRSVEFADEALNRAQDTVNESCNAIQCPLATNRTQQVDQATQVEILTCTFDCVESEIDSTGERRQFFISMVWERAPGQCYETDERSTVQRNFDPCVPDF